MSAENAVRKYFDPEEPILLLTDSDIGTDDKFGKEWLAVTDRRLVVFTDGQTDRPRLDLALKDVENFQNVHVVGAIALRAEMKDKRIEIVRFTNSLSSKYSRIVKALNDAQKNEKPPEFKLEDEERLNCPECGRLLPEKGSFCPACLKKRKVLERFWRYMKPHWRRAIAVSTCIVASSVLELAPPYLVKLLVDDVLTQKAESVT
ncbi:MAG TPA: hypothetical protein PKH07_10720, partial [bacterium]|nr:hypothetical protein [bacterium]